VGSARGRAAEPQLGGAQRSGGLPPTADHLSHQVRCSGSG
jgi:hypothetical protein